MIIEKINENFPYILIHPDLPNVSWVCGFTDETESMCKSAFINKSSKEIIENIFPCKDFEKIKNEMIGFGWKKGFIPEINFKFNQ